MIEMRDKGYPRIKIAKRLGVTMRHVDRILNRVNWKASKQRKLLKGGSLLAALLIPNISRFGRLAH
jgi:transcriptional regulator